MRRYLEESFVYSAADLATDEKHAKAWRRRRRRS